MAQSHAVVASLLAPTSQHVVAALRQLPPNVTHAEVRLDGLWNGVPDEEQATDDLLAITENATIPLIATLRPIRQGGRFEGSEEIRIGLLAAAARAGFTQIDLELDAAQVPGLRATLETAGSQVFASSHEVGEPPCRDDGLRALSALQDAGSGPGPDKFAFQAGSFADALRALELTRAHAQRGGHPTVSALGFGGAPLRALLALVGNHATYGHAPSLPPAVSGQPAIDDITRIWAHWGLTTADLHPRSQGVSPWYALLGMPAMHSLSPRIHNAALQSASRHERYGALDVPASASALRLMFHVAPRLGMAGASVTAPHKIDAARLAKCDSVATAVGAANCVRFDGEQVLATNTDATALLRILRARVDPGVPAVIIGSGGAARAAAWALRECGATVRFTSRDLGRAQQMAKDLGAKWTSWERRSNLLAPIWIQATPGGNENPLVTVPQLKGAQSVIDLAYGNTPTRLERDAKAVGAEVVSGRQVLVEQAVDAYKFWLGQEPDRAAMEAAVAGNR